MESKTKLPFMTTSYIYEKAPDALAMHHQKGFLDDVEEPPTSLPA